MSIIRVEHLEKAFENVTPIKDISFDINQGDVISVIGPSGTGKSTLIRAINMLEKPTDGKIFFHDECINDGSYNLSKLRKSIGMVFQSFNLFSHKTVMENITMAPMDLLGLSKEEAEAKATDLLKKVGLYSKRDNYPDELSGGQKQRIAIARCLAMDPEVILLDEPTSALDPTMINEVKSIIEELADSGKTMMIVTHEMDFAKSIANRVFYLDQGGIYEEGSPEEVFDNPKRERTIAFMKRTKNFNMDIDTSNIDLPEILDALIDFGRKNAIPKSMIYRLVLLVEELLAGIITNNADSIKKLNVFIEYNAEDGDSRVNLYIDGDTEELPFDELRNKIFEAYCKNVCYIENDEGYDMHISFDVDSK